MRPQLAVIKETKSNIDAAWNYLGNKFCVGASSGNVFIGSFDADQGFWTTNTISKNFILTIYRRQETCSLLECRERTL